MSALTETVAEPCSPESLVERLRGEKYVILLRSSQYDPVQGRYSMVVARPFLTLRVYGTRCVLSDGESTWSQFGNPWHVLDGLMGRYELLEEADVPFPLGGCFGYWGYDLKNFVEPRLVRRAANDLELPDCAVGFYDSVVVFDHAVGQAWVVATGMTRDGAHSAGKARQAVDYWRARLVANAEGDAWEKEDSRLCLGTEGTAPEVRSNFTREGYVAAVRRAQNYIRAGDVYQVNLAQRLTAAWEEGGWQFFCRLTEISPAPFSAYLGLEDLEIASSSPELFLRLSGSQIHTRPIKGTRPRARDADRDAQLSYELQTSPKEMAELVMITDLLRNDLGKVCTYGSVRVPELARLERYAQVQHLVATVQGQMRPGVSHLAALLACFPGGSVTGAPKIRAMEIIDELEPHTRGPYTGCLGYLGFNGESQINIVIRTGICCDGRVHFHVGAGIVADSDPDAEYDETMTKAAGFLNVLRRSWTLKPVRTGNKQDVPVD